MKKNDRGDKNEKKASFKGPIETVRAVADSDEYSASCYESVHISHSSEGRCGYERLCAGVYCSGSGAVCTEPGADLRRAGVLRDPVRTGTAEAFKGVGHTLRPAG